MAPAASATLGSSAAVADFFAGRSRRGEQNVLPRTDLTLSAENPEPAIQSTSLTLDAALVDRTTFRGAPEHPVAPPSRAAYIARRINAGTPVALRHPDPTVSLSRVQSGVGVLTVEARCTTAVGDVRLGCAYELHDGTTSFLVGGSQPTTVRRGLRPFLHSQRLEFETITMDLAQVRDLRRLIVCVFSPTHATVAWQGLLTVSTFGGAHADVSLARGPASGVVVALSAYVVNGELVLRGENELVSGSIRDAANSYGFDRIRWLDDDTPLM